MGAHTLLYLRLFWFEFHELKSANSPRGGVTHCLPPLQHQNPALTTVGGCVSMTAQGRFRSPILNRDVGNSRFRKNRFKIKISVDCCRRRIIFLIFTLYFSERFGFVRTRRNISKIRRVNEKRQIQNWVTFANRRIRRGDKISKARSE